MLKRVRISTAAVLAAAALTTQTTLAADIAGVHVDERNQFGNADLVLNGAGIRTKLIFKVYVAALYLPKKATGASTVIGSHEPRRIALHLLRDLDADSLIGALKDGLQSNHSPDELSKLKTEIDQFEGVMRGVGNARNGDIITIDFSGEGTRVGLNGQTRGGVAGETFGPALLRVWLGDKPVDGDLKKALLGS